MHQHREPIPVDGSSLADRRFDIATWEFTAAMTRVCPRGHTEDMYYLLESWVFWGTLSIYDGEHPHLWN
jgi:hypothetical protein